jgi:hypothetical protein
MPIPAALLFLDTEDLIALAVIAVIIGISLLIVSVGERLRRRRLKMKFLLMQRVIDPGSTIWPGPQIRGSFRGRELDGYRRNELIGFTQRGGTNGKTIVEFRCLSPLQFTAFTFPVLPLLAELLHLGSPRVALGDAQVDRSFGFASPDPEGFRTWMGKADNRAVLIQFLSTMPPCRRQRFRLRVEGKLQLNMPEYLFFKMSPERIRHLLEGLDSVACKLEQVGGS